MRSKPPANRKLSTPALLFWVVVVLPTMIAGVYYSLYATNRYAVDVQFSVRSVNGSQGGGLTSLFRTIGISRDEDSTYAVIDYILSRDAVRELGEERLRKFFGSKSIDIFSRYPRFWSWDSFEQLYYYYLNRVEAWYDTKGGLVVLHISAFSPEEVEALARSLLHLSEGLINRMNVRAQGDSVTYAEQEVTRAEQLVIEAQKRLTSFRNTEFLLDPEADAAKLVELVVKLKGDLAEAQRQLSETVQSSPSSPNITGLRSRIGALEEQIRIETAKIGEGPAALAPKVSAYERLVLDKQFADRNLGLAFDALQMARQVARRQQLYIETVVSPNRPDESIEPRSTRNVFTVFTVCFCLFSMLWLIVAGSREHMNG